MPAGVVVKGKRGGGTENRYNWGWEGYVTGLGGVTGAGELSHIDPSIYIHTRMHVHNCHHA